MNHSQCKDHRIKHLSLFDEKNHAVSIRSSEKFCKINISSQKVVIVITIQTLITGSKPHLTIVIPTKKKKEEIFCGTKTLLNIFGKKKFNCKNNPFSRSEDLLTETTCLTTLRQMEGTIILHIMQAVKQNRDLGSELIKYAKVSVRGCRHQKELRKKAKQVTDVQPKGTFLTCYFLSASS